MNAPLRFTKETPAVKWPSQAPTLARFVRDGARFAVLAVPLDDSALRQLSAAEREVAELAVRGMGHAAIAARRGTSVHTVANQLASVFRKLAVVSRCDLAARLALCPIGHDP